MLCAGLAFSIPLRRVRFRWRIRTLLLSDMSFWPVNRLHVLSERAGICVAFCATRDLANIWLLQRSDIQYSFQRTVKTDSNRTSWCYSLWDGMEKAHNEMHVESSNLIWMRAVLVLGPVWGVGKRLVAALVLAHVRFFPRVGPQVSFEVFQSGVRLRATFELWRESGRGVSHYISVH